MKAQSRCYIAFRGILVIKVWSLTGILAGREFVYTVNSTEIKLLLMSIMYFFGYKTEFFSSQNNPKDLDLWDCLGRVKLVL